MFKGLKRNRYFIVFYTATSSIGVCVGYINLHLSGKQSFLNGNNTIDTIKKDDPTLLDVSITNFIEVPKEDYDIWNSQKQIYVL